jgi:predicted lysophospholipase L1 biosynthesis ABC-type transport system permease subunit
VSIERAAQELAGSAKRHAIAFPARLDANNTTEPQLFVESIVGGLQATFYTLLGAVACVLLIACANVASLFLGRLAARQKEIAVRQSLGATRAQVVRQFLVESVVFSTIAGGTWRAARAVGFDGGSIADRFAVATQCNADAELARAVVHRAV